MNRLFVIDSCQMCYQVKQYLKGSNVPYEEINLFHVSHAAKELKNKVGEVVTPVLFTRDDIYVGDRIFTATEKIKVIGVHSTGKNKQGNTMHLTSGSKLTGDHVVNKHDKGRN
ncbi:glutaredoxin family protein [Shouchella shacheensis]|uniref:glutaredoxin family protein n=1 Tax=Shouchella shacheensis TaxID=1649580 RepID=UPI0007403EAB|nr:glutaredoxin [Shouchella shacheensis]